MHKQGVCVVLLLASESWEMAERHTETDSQGLFISLSPITCALVLHVELLTVLNGIDDHECRIYMLWSGSMAWSSDEAFSTVLFLS